MIFLSAMGFMPLCTMIILSKRKSNYLKICLFIYFTQLGDHAHFIFILSYVQDSDISNSLCARPTLEQSSATKPHTALALQKFSLIFYTRNIVSRSQFTKLRIGDHELGIEMVRNQCSKFLVDQRPWFFFRPWFSCRYALWKLWRSENQIIHISVYPLTQLGDHAHFIFILSYVLDSDIFNSLDALVHFKTTSYNM